MGGRASTGGRVSMSGGGGKNSRRSSIHSAATAASDPRPLSDPGFRSNCIRGLIQFLTENGYGHPVSPKLLQSPSDSDVFRIFQFLYHMIDPSYKFSAMGPRDRKSMGGGKAARTNAVKASENMVETIPVLLKTLGYPFKLNRSTLISCGSHSNWPKMLGALHFLLEIVTLQQTVDIDSQIFGEGASGNGFEEDQSTSQRNQLMFEYMQEAYRAFLTGDDDLKAQLDDDMLAQYQDANDDIREMKETLADQNEQLSLELEQLQSSANPQDQLIAKQQVFTTDVAKFQTLIQKLIIHQKKMMAKAEETKLELERRKEESVSFTVEIDRLQSLFDRQELNQADVQRMKTARSKLDDQMISIQKRKEDMDQRAWKQEVMLSKRLEAIDQNVSKYNKSAEQLQILPRESQLAGGVDFEIRMNPHAAEPGQSLLMTDLQNSLMPNIRDLKDRINSAVHQTREQLLGHVEQNKKIQELVRDKNDSVASLRKKLEIGESKYQQQKAVLDDKHRNNMGNIDSLQEEIFQIQHDISAQTAESVRLTDKANADFANAKEELLREKQMFEDVVIRTLGIVTLHKAQIQEFVGEYKKTIREVST
jgi:kinetochore protein NDC80